MQLNKLIFLILISSACLIACNGGKGSKSTAEKKAEEQSQRNPIKKGRYQCYQLSPQGDKIVPDLFILSDNSYQVDDVTGKYSYNHQKNFMQIIDGPLNSSAENWIGYYTAKGSATAGGGQTLESMLEFKKQTDIDSGNKKVMMHCNCVEFE